MATRIRIFLDTSAIFVGIWSGRGGSRMLLQLGEAGAVWLITSQLAIRELEGGLREKAPEALGALALVLDRADLHVAGEASDAAISAAREFVTHPADVGILAAAMDASIQYFVTLDQKHFLNNRQMARSVPFEVGTPGECLDWLRGRFRRMARMGGD